MAADKIPTDEKLSDADSCDGVNPLYSLATSRSDHSSLGRPRPSGTGDQSANETAQVHRPVPNSKPEDTASASRPSDASKTFGGSLPSVSALQISRPPTQTPSAGDEQQSAPTKVQPPPAPVVPLRLVRAQSAAKPATNIPKVNCPEKIVICLDISKEMEKKSFVLRQGDKKTPLDLVIRALNIFMQTKRSLNSRHEFALMFLDSCAKWVCDFTGDPKRIMTFLNELKSCVEAEKCDLSTVFNEIACHIMPPDVPSDVPPPYVIRVLLIYGRSYCEPCLTITKQRKALEQSSYVCVDVFYVHDPVTDENQCKSIYQQLCSLDVRGTSYIVEASKNPTKVFDCLAQLLAHPLQRPLQHNLNYSLIPNAFQQYSDPPKS